HAEPDRHRGHANPASDEQPGAAGVAAAVTLNHRQDMRRNFQPEGRKMRRTFSWMVGGLVVAGTFAHADPAAAGPSPRDLAAAEGAVGEMRELKESRYQIGKIERLLEGAVEHGATVIRDRLLAIMPADMLLTENARARGFRLDGYGVFFDVEVPSLEGTLPW